MRHRRRRAPEGFRWGPWLVLAALVALAALVMFGLLWAVELLIDRTEFYQG